MSFRLLMIGFLVDFDAFAKYSKCDSYPQVAARKFEFGFLDGFLANGVDVNVLGSFPSSIYPLNPFIYFPFKIWRYRSARCWMLPFVNLPGIKLGSRFLAFLIGLVVWVAKNGRPDAICVYAAHSPYLLVAFLVRFIFRVQFFVVIPDLPQFMDVGSGRGWVRALLKRIDDVLIKYLVSSSSGIAVVSKFIAEDVPQWSCIPHVVVEGLCPDGVEFPAGVKHRAGAPYFMYSGSLHEAYGVGVLVRAFMSTDLDAELWLCGSGSLVDYIKRCSETDKRIKYLGYLGQDELRAAQQGASALLLTRSPDEPYVRYSFPSKLIEYMTTGVPVICTRLPGIPDEYLEFLTVLDKANECDIADALKTHLSRDESSLYLQGRRAFEFVRNRKNSTVSVLGFLQLMRGCNERVCR